MYINVFLIFVFICQYGLAISNISDKNTPMKFPDPFDNDEKLNLLSIPWYKSVPLFVNDNGKWAYYFSLMISAKRVQHLWFDGAILLLANAYFITFYSTIYDNDIEISDDKNINDIIKMKADIAVKKYEERNLEYTPKSSSPTEKLFQKKKSDASISKKIKSVTDQQIKKMIDNFHGSSDISKAYKV